MRNSTYKKNLDKFEKFLSLQKVESNVKIKKEVVEGEIEKEINPVLVTKDNIDEL